ncbi:MAG: hypothetical protein AB7F76_14155, partial [Parvibaculaceae bacterium]
PLSSSIPSLGEKREETIGGGSGQLTEAEIASAFLRSFEGGRLVRLPGPVGERNLYGARPRGQVAVIAATETGVRSAIGAIIASGNRAVIAPGSNAARVAESLSPDLAAFIEIWPDWRSAEPLAAILHEGPPEELREILRWAAAREGPLVQVQGVSSRGLEAGTEEFAPELLVEEVSISTNTAAAGGNPGLMTLD